MSFLLPSFDWDKILTKASISFRFNKNKESSPKILQWKLPKKILLQKSYQKIPAKKFKKKSKQLLNKFLILKTSNSQHRTCRPKPFQTCFLVVSSWNIRFKFGFFIKAIIFQCHQFYSEMNVRLIHDQLDISSNNKHVFQCFFKKYFLMCIDRFTVASSEIMA